MTKKSMIISRKQGDYWVSVISFSNVSGYGKTKKESLNDLKYNINVLCQDLLEVSSILTENNQA